MEITAEAGGWVEVSSAVKARIGVTSAETIALASETEFTSKHVTLKVASTVGALAASTAVKASRVALTLERSSEAFFPLGTDDAPEFDRGPFEARGEFVVRLGDTQYEDDFLSNALKAMSITISNGNDSLAFTASKVRYRELEVSRDRDSVVTATVQFFCEFDTAANSSIVPLLKNTRATYVAA
ncbi:phage tail tube protein [Rathayibacter oskolensis]|uniref:phage tail tube protein n=1 Tax=Rathayibacter oskolensis TaxID=1891671 RepID=UPI00265DE453|nr:phage tail tube protein [Rathayibacter oskolensis]WKK71449.1 phage tail tube protein [Rathayibacter oskolensis]